MKNSYKVALLAALGLASVSVAQAQTYNDDDLLLGITSSSQDYVVDLGQIPASANTAFSSTSLSSIGTSGLSAGVIGGDNDGTYDVLNGGETLFVTTLRTGTAPTSYASAGTESAPGVAGATSIDTSISDVYNVAQGLTGLTTPIHSAWSQIVAQSSTATGTDNGNVGAQIGNPMAALGSSPVTLDLWTANDDNAHNTFTYLGDIELIPSGSSLNETFDPVAAPEPSTYGLLAGTGLLAIALRRQLVRKNA